MPSAFIPSKLGYSAMHLVIQQIHQRFVHPGPLEMCIRDRWGTPVPIPNTMVKTQTADGTLLETARESRWMPAFIKKILYNPYGDAEHEFDSHYTVQI